MRRSFAPSLIKTNQNEPNILSDILNSEENHIKELKKLTKGKTVNEPTEPSELETFQVIYGRQTSKKHKSFEDDGTLVVDKTKKKAYLKSSDGKTINVDHSFKDPVESGSRISIGDKLVEIVGKLGGCQEEAAPKSVTKKVPVKRAKNVFNPPVVVQESIPASSSSPGSSVSYIVTFGRQTTKMHKTFEEDGVLVHDADSKKLILKSTDGKVVNIEPNYNSTLEIGKRVDVGNKLVEIVEKIEASGSKTGHFGRTTMNPRNPYKPPIVSGPRFDRSDRSQKTDQGPSASYQREAIPSIKMPEIQETRRISKFVRELSPEPDQNFQETREISKFDREFSPEPVESFQMELDTPEYPKLPAQASKRPTKYEEFNTQPTKKFKQLPAIEIDPDEESESEVEPEPELKPEPPTKIPFFLPDPDFEHQWKFNERKRPMTRVAVPDCVADFLRPYQKDGVTFLYRCVMGFNVIDGQHYFGAILADEMGLGKTLQCISLMYTLMKSGPYSEKVAKRILIVAPSGLLGNWDKEILKWLKNERVFTFIADGKKTIHEFKNAAHIPIMLISYEMFLKHEQAIQEIRFDLMLCDEAHRLKNTELKLTVALNKIDCSRRILLTGTPFQNNFKEFYSLINFVNPNVLGTYQEFKNHYETPIVQSQQASVLPEYKFLGEERAKELNDLTSQFILRRTQEIIKKYLPKKQEVVIFVRPRKIQQDLIRKLLELYEKQQVDKEGVLTRNLMPLELIILLKKLCNHPNLLTVNPSQTEKEILKHLEINIKDFNPKYSGKAWILTELLQQLVEKREKIVVVSYYTQTLNMLEVISRKFDFKFVRIDGSTKGADRPKIIGKFNDPEDDTFIFLLSAKSGGVGLNLVGASRLILFDNDWNPSSDLQALARIYRDGQTRDTYIYRFITTGTIEEKIYQRQISKTTLSGCVIDAKSGSSKDKFSSAELRELFGTENLEFDDCQTHQIIECFCEGAGVVPSSSQSFQVDDSDSDEEENPYRIKLNDQNEKDQDKSALKMHELMKWEHHNWPVSEQLLEELCLKTCQDFISFIFRNQNLDTNEN